MVGTIMQGSHITLRQWLQAFHAMSASKKGISALQLKRNLGLKSYKSAWHMAHRIRYAMDNEPAKGLLSGVVAADETYVGGKPPKDGKRHKRGRGTSKTPVMALIQKNGQARAKAVSSVSARSRKQALDKNVTKEATIMTDELPSYGPATHGYKSHRSMNHSEKEYARGKAHANGAESFFVLLKRGIHGIFHHVSKRHLHRYADEFSFRWSHRKESDGERTVETIKGIAGKRLAYAQTVKGAA
jgi:hypothetical protein